MLFALSFVSMFIIGGLSGIFMAATPVDIFIHDTYFIVAHFHYVLFAGTAMGVFGAIYFWFPKMFGRMMNESWGKVHFFFTFVFLNGTFFPMHILGVVGFPRRLADAYQYAVFHNLQPMNEFITWCAIGMVATQAVFMVNFIYSIFFGKKWDGIPGGPMAWNGLLPVRRDTAILTSSRLCTGGPTSMARRNRTPIFIRKFNHLQRNQWRCRKASQSLQHS